MTCCDGGMMGGWGWMWLVGAFWLLLIVAGIVLVVWAVSRGLVGRGGSESGASASERDPALSTLRERFARGEIDESQYLERRRTLDES